MVIRSIHRNPTRSVVRGIFLSFDKIKRFIINLLLSTSTRNSPTTGFTDGLLVTYPANTPSFNEGDLQNYNAGTNKQLQSEDFADGEWTKDNVTINSAVETSGDLTLDRLNVMAGAAAHQAFTTNPFAVTSGVDETVTCFIKDDGERYAFISLFGSANDFVSAVFDLNDGSNTDSDVGGTSGTLTIADAKLVATNLWRLRLTANIALTSSRILVGGAGSATPTFSSGQPTYTAVDGEDLLIGGAQSETSPTPTPYIHTTTTAVTRSADVTTVDVPSFVKQDGDWAFKFRGTPHQTAQALKALFSFDSDATNYTEIQLNAANITANSVLGGVSNGAAVGPYVHTVDVPFETNVYYVASTKTLGIRSDDVSGDISAVAFVEDVLTSHPVITSLLSTGNRNSLNQAVCDFDNDGVPVFYINKGAAGW